MGHGFFDLGGWERSFEADVVWAKGARVIPQMWRRLPLPLAGRGEGWGWFDRVRESDTKAL
jgi:hypothetical protein